jgi:hypothetical protein
MHAINAKNVTVALRLSAANKMTTSFAFLQQI